MGEREQNTIHGISEINEYVASLIGNNDVEQRKKARALQVQQAWEDIAPEEVLAHTDNIYIYNVNEGDKTKKTMTVYVDSPLWAAELTARQMQIKKSMERRLNEGPLDEVRFMPSSETYKRKKFLKHQDKHESTETQSIPLTEEELQNVIQEVGLIENEQLREAFLRARIADLEWKKGIEVSKRR